MLIKCNFDMTDRFSIQGQLPSSSVSFNSSSFLALPKWILYIDKSLAQVYFVDSVLFLKN
jgi:hypothetical protein